MKKAMLIVILGAAIAAPAAAQHWLDDFEDGSAVDGSPVSWTASPGFPSEFDVAGGDLVMTLPDGASQPITSARVPINFGSGASVRARMIGYNGPGRYTVAFADQPTGIKGYVASFNTCLGGRIELFRGDVPGAIVILGIVNWPSGPLEEFLIQLDVFDGTVSARVWRPGEPFPEPQISAPDSTYSEGVASVAIQDFGGGTTGCPAGGDFTDVVANVRYAQASATPLTHSGAGDTDADGDIDLFDVAPYFDCVSGPGGEASEACEVFDFDGDGDIDLADLGVLQREFGVGPLDFRP
jgi:hypothetical protein